MSVWTDQMDRALVLTRDTFGKVTSYERPGFPAFSISGVPDFRDRLESVNQGQFYSIFYRVGDFARLATFTASLRVRFTGVPNADGYVILDGVTYTAVLAIDNSTPYQFLRGSSALGAASNLTACINADQPLAGTFFSGSTPQHPTCSAAWVDNGDGSGSVIVSADAPGLDADSLRAEDHISFASLDSKIFYGGGPLNNDLVTFDGTLFRVSDVPEMDPEGAIQVRLEKKAL